MSELNGTPVEVTHAGEIQCEITYTERDLVIMQFMQGGEPVFFVNLTRDKANQWGDALKWASTQVYVEAPAEAGA